MSEKKRTEPGRILELLWGTETPPNRGPKPKFTRAQVVDAGIAVADAEGLEQLSMRRVAEHLGTGTMSLYTYVPGRAELLHLMLDRVTGTLPPLPGDASWRTALEQWARDARDLAARHPWTSAASTPGLLLMGPHTTARSDALYGALAPLGLAPRETARIANSVEAYVRGVCRALADQQADTRQSGVDYERWWEQATPHLTRLITRERFPHLYGLWEQGAFEEPADAGFEFGLRRLLDGIEAGLEADRPEGGR
ncbi:TetR/AcrR family transcriptional regulator [Kitasatospora sp. NPDC096147]|uniref:TetR/AcrR family transcriptional regulator n=1 Tax=Kitasatospora sp. NPDC096147 TaxID=3364093 RepID=UPI0038083644